MGAATGIEGPRIVIAGGGLAGLSLALALKQALAGNLDVVMCDPALTRDPHGDKRAYAIAAAACRTRCDPPISPSRGRWTGASPSPIC